MHRRKSSKSESPSDMSGAGTYGNRSPLSPPMSQAGLNVPLMTRERNVQAAMMKPPTNGVYSSIAASSSNLSLASKSDTLASHAPPGSVSSKYMLTPDPSKWGANVYLNVPEPDDHLHNPDPRRDRLNDGGGSVFNIRGLTNLGCLLILALILTGLFAVYPITDSFLRKTETLGAYNLGGINASGQVPEIAGGFGLIDKDTPQSAYTHTSLEDGSEWDLVFSDEFNTDGRSFYPGDDPYWEAVDLHYWGTNNLEWYSPDQVTTSGGFLNITLQETPWRDLNYKGGMIASWNKFCFTGGYFVANVSLPGTSKVHGLWPAVWAMGNLGRAGFGASLEGMWPYTYDTCDVGTLPNQTFPDHTPYEATIGGDKDKNGALSYLQGQRLSACTCPGESHPGPIRSDGTFVGRAAPEIDVFEAIVTDQVGYVSQSGQWAPFNYKYVWKNTSENLHILSENTEFNTYIGGGFQLWAPFNYKYVWKNTSENLHILSENTEFNTYIGGGFQQCSSGLSKTNQACYEKDGGCFAVYGFEYRPGNDGYILWTNDNEPAWKMYGAGMGPDDLVKIGQRPVPQEPMYMIINLGISPQFGGIDFEHLTLPATMLVDWHLTLPATMLVDWVRVYQPKNNHNIGCDPPDFPTRDYINTYIEAYTNPNLTTWVDDYKQVVPKNRLVDQC
ncbi:unnamed protein product [Rhizoctonia solani]|uniref:GH16 domain-containing protein n=1 Tax=Rhizoctonia solani TaxID=456999 RepID=A0A8H3HKQ4_9AGAM|nr:unnamed protein product [Rhizoctonia solani]